MNTIQNIATCTFFYGLYSSDPMVTVLSAFVMVATFIMKVMK